MNLTSKYKLVLEGKLAKSEFLRQVRQSYPQQITQFTSYEDAIKIFKNKGMLTEEVEYQCKGDKFSLGQIEKGLRYELKQMGLSDMCTPSPEEYRQAKKKAIDNLVKDSMYYVKKIEEGKMFLQEQKRRQEAVARKKRAVMEARTRRVAKQPKQEVVTESEEVFKGKEEKKMLKEAISKVISKVLTEAATTNLANFSDQNATIQGIPAIMNNLENIVTEIESFIIKEQAKVQSAFDSIGAIKNEDNIPIGYKFVEPIMDAFIADLQPVLDKISLDSIKVPEAPESLDQEMEQPEGEEPTGPGIDPEMDMAPEEKATLFTPKGTKPNPLA